jgi:hypothetical protein
MTTPAIEHTTAPSPIDVLELRAWARAYLWWAGLIETIPEAVDPLQAFAVASGLAHELGQGEVQRIIADAFQQYQEAAP